jgi:hypothetical protein
MQMDALHEKQVALKIDGKDMSVSMCICAFPHLVANVHESIDQILARSQRSVSDAKKDLKTREGEKLRISLLNSQS